MVGRHHTILPVFLTHILCFACTSVPRGLRCRADTDFNRLQAPLFFTGDVTQSAVGFPSEDSEGLLNFMWTFQAIAEESS